MTQPDPQKRPLLEVEGLRKRIAGRTLLADVSLACAAGEIVAVLGENGVGKSTLLRLLCGVLQPDRGTVLLAGADVLGTDWADRRHIGYAPDGAAPLPELTLLELVRLTAALKGAMPPPADLARRLGVEEVLSRRLGTLSLGQRRRAGLLLALVGEPRLLLLDEPSSGLDPAGIAMLVALLQERAGGGGAVLLTSNDLPFVSLLQCRRLRLRDGGLQAEPG